MLNIFEAEKYPEIIYSVEDSVADIRLNRPDKHNALSYQMLEGIKAAVFSIPDEVRVVILSGVGKSFCAGADLQEIACKPDYLDLIQAVVAEIDALPVPVIATLKGATIGGGVQLALAADLRVMESSAFISVPAAKIGVAIDTWTIRRLVNLIGKGPASSILYCCERFSAQSCGQFGFVNQVGTYEVAKSLAYELASYSADTLKHYKVVMGDDQTRDPYSLRHNFAQINVWAKVRDTLNPADANQSKSKEV